MEIIDMRIGVIYKYTSPSGKVYIGQTINEKSRKNKHKTDTPLGTTYFGKAINKYGFDNIKYEVIIKFKPADKVKVKRVLNKLEQRYIRIYKSDNSKYGYNLNEGGDGNIGYKHTPEALVKIKYNNQNMSQETKDKISLAMSGKIKNKEHRQTMSNSSTNKKVVEQYDMDGIFIQEFKSMSEAFISLNQTSTLKTVVNKISECCLEKRKSAYKFIWKYKTV